MTEAHWAFSVRDRHGRTRRGRVVYSERVDAAGEGPGGFAEFVILILDQPAEVSHVADATAVCIPRPRKLHALRDAEANKLPSRLQDLTFRPHRMGEYAEGHIVLAHGAKVDASDIFPVHSEHPRLDRLALTLLETKDADAIAPYLAIIRHELELSAEADAVTALSRRLTPAAPSAQLPAKAPALVRLAKTAKSLRQGLIPELALEQLAEDLRFLRLFDADEERWPDEALSRLLGDVRGGEPTRRKQSGPSRSSRSAEKLLHFPGARPPGPPGKDA